MRKRTRFYARCIPDFSYKSVYEIPYNGLFIRGVTTLFFDLDNTLIAYNQPKLSEKLVEFLNNLSNYFQIIILSNNKKNRVEAAIGKNFQFVYSAKKPLKSGFKKALKMANEPAYKVAVIGDQLLTDIYGAWRIQAARKILVRPIRRNTDILSTRINRYFEQKVMNKIKKKKPLMYDSRFKNYLG